LDDGGVAPHPSPQAITAGTMIGEWRIEERVGAGAMGVVYRAVHPLLGRRGAIKVMQPHLWRSESIDRFVREARAVASLGHPNIVDAFSFGSLADGRCYFVMEWLEGENLRQRRRRGPLALAEAIDVLEQVCCGLEAAHARGIVHRDLKPDNVFLSASGSGRWVVKLLDFGVAKLEANARITQTGAIVGTPGYLSPEQALGTAVDARADIYSLGVMAFEALVGELPFPAGIDSAHLLRCHVDRPAPRGSTIAPDLPPELDELLVRMLQKQPADRPSLVQVQNVLASIRESRRASTVEPPDTMPRTRSRRTLALGALAAAIAVGVTAAIAWQSRDTAPPPRQARPADPAPNAAAPVAIPVFVPSAPIVRVVQPTPPETTTAAPDPSVPTPPPPASAADSRPSAAPARLGTARSPRPSRAARPRRRPEPKVIQVGEDDVLVPYRGPR
jgi:serine/threonine-protein kinase